MPYSASDVSALPANVQAMPARQRRQWAQVWNSAYAAAKKAGKSDKDAEASAFAQANGVVAKLAAHSTFADDSGGHWVTIDGNPVLLGGGGRIMAGGSHLGGVGAIVGHPQPKFDLSRALENRLKDITLKGEKDGDGSLAHPIDAGSDLNLALKLLGEGKHIRLDQPDQVNTLLDKLNTDVQDAKAKGAKAPNYDLGNVTVAGASLFVTQSKGLSRAEMPQLMGKPIPGSPASKGPLNARGEADLAVSFREALSKIGVKTTLGKALASHLMATQTELSGPKVAGMMKSMEAGTLPDAPIFVTRDNYILDGHHRWAATVGIDSKDNLLGNLTMPVNRINMDIGAALDFSKAYAAEMGIPQAKAFSLFRLLAQFGWVTINGNHIFIGDSKGGAGGGGGHGGAAVSVPSTTHVQTAQNEVGIVAGETLPWDMKAEAPGRYPGDTSIYSPAMKDAAGKYALGRRLQGSSIDPKVTYVNPKGETVNGAPDQVAMHVFIPASATTAQRAAFESSIIAHSDHAQLHEGEMQHQAADGTLSKTEGDNYWVRGDYRQLNGLAADIGPKLEAQFGKNQHITMMADQTPGGTAIPTGAEAEHFRVVVPFAAGTPKNTVGAMSLPPEVTDKIASVMSGPEGRGVVSHLDFNGMHIGVSTTPDIIDKLYPVVRALGQTQSPLLGSAVGADQHNLGATKFIPTAINLERYPVRSYTRGAGFAAFSTTFPTGEPEYKDGHWAGEHATGYSEEGSPALFVSLPLNAGSPPRRVAAEAGADPEPAVVPTSSAAVDIVGSPPLRRSA